MRSMLLQSDSYYIISFEVVGIERVDLYWLIEGLSILDMFLPFWRDVCRNLFVSNLFTSIALSLVYFTVDKLFLQK